VIHTKIVTAQGDKMLKLDVRKVDNTRIMIQGDVESLLYLSEYIKEHATQNITCEADVPLSVNLIETPLHENKFELYLHRLPCDENK